MVLQPKKRVLFTGYAPVHFLCFLPVYQQLQGDLDLDVWLSGGFRHKSPDGAISYELDGFYDPYPVHPDRTIPIEQARNEDFDVLVCAHLSDSLFPRSAKKTVQIFHGVSFKNYAVREKALRFDILCLPGDYHTSLFQERGLIRDDGPEAYTTGFAKTDRLVDGTLDRDALLRGLGLDPGKPTLLYAPTGDKNNSLEIMGEQVIAHLAKEPVWNLLIKPHDHPKNKIDWFEKLAPYEGSTVRLMRDLDVIPYLHAADLLISDASSVITEFTLLDRPIVLLNVPKLFKRVVKRGGALDLDTYGQKLGPVVDDPVTIVEVVRSALADSSPYSALRRAMARDFFYQPGTAAKRVAKAVRYAAGLLDWIPIDTEPLEPDAIPRPDDAEMITSPVPVLDINLEHGLVQ